MYVARFRRGGRRLRSITIRSDRDATGTSSSRSPIPSDDNPNPAPTRSDPSDTTHA